MPLEVKELHIRVTVNDGNRLPKQSDVNYSEAKTKEAIIQICVERVLDILKRKQER
ncbi:MAG: DUF5908 family protein [Bacteroidota bacterium]